MLTIDEQKEIERELHGMIGQPYEPKGCSKFVMKAFALCGINVSLTKNEAAPQMLVKESRDFVEVDQPRFGDVAVFKDARTGKFHIAFMVGRRWAFQSGEATNGVARIDITRDEWKFGFKAFCRHKALCS